MFPFISQFLVHDFVNHLEEWKSILESETPQRDKIPRSENRPPITNLQKLCVLRCLRPDKIVAGISDFVAGKKYSQNLFWDCVSDMIVKSVR